MTNARFTGPDDVAKTADAALELAAEFRAYRAAPAGLAAAFNERIDWLVSMRRMLVREALRRGASVQSVADMLRISRPTVYAWANADIDDDATIISTAEAYADADRDAASFLSAMLQPEPADEPYEPEADDPREQPDPDAERTGGLVDQRGLDRGSIGSGGRYGEDAS